MTERGVGPTSATPASRGAHAVVRAAHSRRARRVAFSLLTGLVVVLGIAAGLVAHDALRARSALERAQGDVRELRAQAELSDTSGAEASLGRLQSRAGEAYAHTHGPLWSAAAALPWVGADARAVRTVTEVVDDLATGALPALMQATALADPATLAPTGGRVDLAPIIEVEPQVSAADVTVQAARGRLERIDADALTGAVARPVAALRALVVEIAATTATAARAAELVPSMMGADGPREYLLLVQNNAEARATGGIPGAIVLLGVDRGTVTIVEQRGAAGALASLPAPVLPLSPAEDALFGPMLGTQMADVNFTPDFPRSAALAREMWLRQFGGTVDGVLSMDPGALAHVLAATGPVTTAGGVELTSANAVELLLHTVYRDIADPAAQDVFYASAASAVFNAVASGRGNAAAMVEALAQSAREGRVLVWSAHADEQARLLGTVLSGELRGAAEPSGQTPVVGVYLNDGTEAKMGYYLDLQVAGTATACFPDGSQRLHVTVTLTSSAPADVAGLPVSITGLGIVVPKGVIRTNVLVYAPAGGSIESSTMTMGSGELYSQVHDGLSVGAITAILRPGQSGLLELDIRSGPGQRRDSSIRVTPTARRAGPIAITTAC